MNREIRSFTGIRGIAALYITLYHFIPIFKTNSINIANILSTPVANIYEHGYISVDLFFVLSAFVITLSSKRYFVGKFTLQNYKIFMTKRWKRIYPSYFIVTLFAFIVVYNFSRKANFVFSLTLLNNLFGIPSFLGHLWSLSTEWVMYLFFPLIMNFCFAVADRYSAKALFFIGVVMLILSTIVAQHFVINGFNLNIYQGYPSLLRCLGGYILGIGSFKICNDTSFNKFHNNAYSLGITILLVLLLAFTNTDILIVILFSFIIIAISKDNNIVAMFLGSKIPYFLGVISYPLYLIHYLIFQVFAKQIANGPTQQFFLTHTLIVFLMYIVTCLIFASLFTFLIETPLIGFINKKIK